MNKNLKCITRKVVSRLFLLVGVILCGVCFADPATDPLAAAIKPQVAALFGAGSTVAYCIYIAEVILGSAAYIKTKNIMLFLGVPLLILFTHSMFKYIGG